MASHAWLEPFAPAFRAAVTLQLETGGQHKLACFDADGTLWAEDLGEALFRWLAAGDLLPHLGRGIDPHAVWHEYEAKVAKNRADGYAWAVQCMAGLKEADLVTWCRQLASAWPTYRPAMAGLVKGLRHAGYEVWLVSASNRWVIEAGAAWVGAKPDQVLGMGVELDGPRLSERRVTPLTCNQGKVDAIRQRLGRTPDLAVGDSLGDLEMLESAALPLVIGRHDKPNADLPRIAAERGWPVHLF
jgi:phosphoserine phosphatase